jgi:signal peptidase II
MIVLLDHVSKYVIKTVFQPYEQLTVIKGFFNIIHVHNSGAIWGIFNNHPNAFLPVLITILSISAFCILCYFFLRLKSDCRLELISLSFIMGGAIGNNIDRIFRGYVIDFIDLHIKSAHWPTFNIADSFIFFGVIFLAVSIWKGGCLDSKK